MSLTIILLPDGNFRLGCPGLVRDVLPADLVAVATRILQAQKVAPPLSMALLPGRQVRHYTTAGKEKLPTITIDDLFPTNTA